MANIKQFQRKRSNRLQVGDSVLCDDTPDREYSVAAIHNETVVLVKGNVTQCAHISNITIITHFNGPQTHKNCAKRLKIGDTVVITKPKHCKDDNHNPLFWAKAWCAEMDGTIGLRAKIVDIREYGVRLRPLSGGNKILSIYTYPAYGLQLVLEGHGENSAPFENPPTYTNEDIVQQGVPPTLQFTSNPEEPQMATEAPAMIRIEHKTFVNGTDVTTLSTEAIVCIIYESEQQIDRLNALRTKPKRVLSKIDELQAGINKLVELVDERESG